MNYFNFAGKIVPIIKEISHEVEEVVPIYLSKTVPVLKHEPVSINEEILKDNITKGAKNMPEMKPEYFTSSHASHHKHMIEGALKGTATGLGIIIAGGAVGVTAAGIQHKYVHTKDNLDNSLHKMEP
jgi:hypothetical protein